MENRQSTVELIRRNACPGLIFKSGDDMYTIYELRDTSIIIHYFDSIEEIPWDIFCKVMMEENTPHIVSWKNTESTDH